MKLSLEGIVNKAKKLVLVPALALAMAMPSYAQNKVSGYIESVPSLTGADSAEVILQNSSTGQKYASLTNAGNVSFTNIPNGQYFVKVLAPDHFLYNDSMLTPLTINGN